MRYDDHYKKCPVCKKPHIVGDLDAYVFQRDVKEGFIFAVGIASENGKQKDIKNAKKKRLNEERF